MTGTSDLLAPIVAAGGDPLDLPFWAACREGRFLVHRCGICGRAYWPASRCVEHGDRDMAWVDASGRGTLYTYTVMHHAYTPEMRGETPYVVGVVKLEEGPFFHTRLVDCPVEAVAVDMPLRAVMTAHPNGMTLPMFRPA
jgi:uncharacterized OB-fold protein